MTFQPSGKRLAGRPAALRRLPVAGLSAGSVRAIGAARRAWHPIAARRLRDF